MSASGAFRRALPCLAVVKKEGVSEFRKLGWKQLPRDGEITRTLSPNEQNVITPWLPSFPRKVMIRAPYYFVNMGITVGLTYFGWWYCVTGDEKIAYDHRF